jgi:hypothetical protein
MWLEAKVGEAMIAAKATARHRWLSVSFFFFIGMVLPLVVDDSIVV